MEFMKKLSLLFFCSLFLSGTALCMDVPQDDPDEADMDDSFEDEEGPSGFFWVNPRQPLPNDPEIKAYFESRKLHRWCTKGYDKIVPAVIDGGAIVFERRYSKVHFTPANTQAHLEALKNVCWFLYSLHPKFNNGMFVMKERKQSDGSMPTWDFFNRYFEKTTDSAHRKPVLFSTNGLSYARYSTHFTKSQAAGKTQIGIDSRKEQGAWEEYDLPHGCSTMLCGELAENGFDNSQEYGRWFLKPEKYGLCGALATARHAEGVVGSACRKILPKLLGASWGEWIAGSNDQDCHCKEHLPLALKEEYKRVCAARGIVPSHVGSITELLQEMEKYDQGQFNELQKIIYAKYPYANERFGREVYLTDRELQGPALYCWLAKKTEGLTKEKTAWSLKSSDLRTAKKKLEKIYVEHEIDPSSVESIRDLLQMFGKSYPSQFGVVETVIRANYIHPDARTQFASEFSLTDFELQPPAPHDWLATKEAAAKKKATDLSQEIKALRAEKETAFELAKKTLSLLDQIKGKSSKEEPGLHAELFQVQKSVDSLTLKMAGGLEESVFPFEETLV